MDEGSKPPPGGEALERVEAPDGLEAAVDEAAFGGLAPLDALQDPAALGATVLKENPKRKVFLLRVGDASIVVKHYHEEGARDRLKALLGRSRARREWATAAALRAAGLPAPAPVGWARRTEGPDSTWSAFAMRAVPDAAPLGGFLEERFAPGDGRGEERRPWLEGAASLLARIHAAGFDHQDFHGGNLLVEGAAAGRPGGLVVVDLHRVTRPWRVAPACRIRALADLMHTLRFAVDPNDTAVAVAAYLRAAGRPAAEAPRWIALVHRASRRREERRVRSRTRRCIRDSSGFRSIATGGVRGFGRRDVPSEVLFDAVEAARAAIASGAPAARSIARRSSVAVANMDGRRVAVKVYEGDGVRSLRGRVSRGRAGRAYVAAHGLFVRDVPVPAVVAWLRTPDRGFLVVDEIEEASPLSALSFELAPGGRRASDLPRVVDAVAALLERLFESGASVNDLSPKNVLVRIDGPVARAWLCDFDGVRFGGSPRRERLLRALAQLNDLAPGVGARARLAVLRRVARRVPSLAGCGVAREIAARTAARAAKQLRAPSPVSVRGGAA